MKNEKITLESTALEFNKWRERRKAGEAVPDKLWKMVAKIYDHYPHTLLCQKLNLRLAQLKAKGFEPNSQDFISPLAEEVEPSPFVHVPPVPTEATVASRPQTELPPIEIHRPDGFKLIFKPSSDQHLATIVQHFIGA